MTVHCSTLWSYFFRPWACTMMDGCCFLRVSCTAESWYTKREKWFGKFENSTLKATVLDVSKTSCVNKGPHRVRSKGLFVGERWQVNKGCHWFKFQCLWNYILQCTLHKKARGKKDLGNQIGELFYVCDLKPEREHHQKCCLFCHSNIKNAVTVTVVNFSFCAHPQQNWQGLSAHKKDFLIFTGWHIQDG